MTRIDPRWRRNCHVPRGGDKSTWLVESGVDEARLPKMTHRFRVPAGTTRLCPGLNLGCSRQNSRKRWNWNFVGRIYEIEIDVVATKYALGWGVVDYGAVRGERMKAPPSKFQPHFPRRRRYHSSIRSEFLSSCMIWAEFPSDRLPFNSYPSTSTVANSA